MKGANVRGLEVTGKQAQYISHFSDAFTELRNRLLTLSYLFFCLSPLSFCPPCLPYGISQLSLERFLLNMKLGIFKKCVQKIKISLKFY